MELIREIYEKDIFDSVETADISYKLRKAARALVFDEAGKIALLHVSKHNYHKLPGGGIEAGEDINTALRRELMEEVGVDVEVLGEIGAAIEYRDRHQLLQISYCYFSEVVGDIHKPAYTEEEINGGFSLKWVSLEEAFDILESDNPDNYVGLFIRSRDLTFIKAYKHQKDFTC